MGCILFWGVSARHLALIHSGRCGLTVLGSSILSQGKNGRQSGLGHVGAVLKCVKGFCGRKGSALSYETQSHHQRETVLGGLTERSSAQGSWAAGPLPFTGFPDADCEWQCAWEGILEVPVAKGGHETGCGGVGGAVCAEQVTGRLWEMPLRREESGSCLPPATDHGVANLSWLLAEPMGGGQGQGHGGGARDPAVSFLNGLCALDDCRRGAGQRLGEVASSGHFVRVAHLREVL